MRLFLIKLVIWCTGLGRPHLKEQAIQWLVGGCASDNRSQVGPKLKAQMDRVVQSRKR